MKMVQHSKLKPSRVYLGVVFPCGVPVELPPSFPEAEVSTLLSNGWQIVPEPTPNLRPVDGGPVLDPIDPNPIPTPKAVEVTAAVPVVETTTTESPVVDVEETKTTKPLEFHRNPAVVNRKK